MKSHQLKTVDKLNEAINGLEHLVEKIRSNNDVVRQRMETFEALHARNAKLLRMLEAMRAKLAIPEWSQLDQSASGGMPSQSGSCRQFGGAGNFGA